MPNDDEPPPPPNLLLETDFLHQASRLSVALEEWAKTIEAMKGTNGNGRT